MRSGLALRRPPDPPGTGRRRDLPAVAHPAGHTPRGPVRSGLVGGVFEVVDLLADDYRRVEEVMIAYEDLSIGFVDASIAAVAERLDASVIATLNYRDFSVVRPSRRSHVTLHPEILGRR